MIVSVTRNLTFLLVALCCMACSKQHTDSFAWNKATVYFVLVDRFCNGDSTNDQQYGIVRGREANAIQNVDLAQGFRSDYDWSAPNNTLMVHYRKLCAFRKAHPAVGA